VSGSACYATHRLRLMRDTPAMLRELNLVEQRYQAVLQVLDGIPVTEVAERFWRGSPDSASLVGPLPGWRY
jgi:hypothetical protein